MRVAAGALRDLPDDTCVPVGDGAAIVVRIGDDAHAFANRCLHQDAPLSGGWVRDGVLSCPLHFWRYRVAEGTHIETGRQLLRYPVEIIDGEVHVEIPDPEPPMPLRDQLLARARTYDRDADYHHRITPLP